MAGDVPSITDIYSLHGSVCCYSKMHYDKIRSYLKLAVEEGGTILTGEGVGRLVHTCPTVEYTHSTVQYTHSTVQFTHSSLQYS